MKNPFGTRQADVDVGGDGSVVVLGLGRFGRALGVQLVKDGREVLGVDNDEEVVQSLHGVLTQVVRADTTNEEALRQLAVPQFDHAVVGIGSHIEASILTSSNVLGFGVEQIWAKAISEPHGRILTRLGVHHVVYPEADMGRRVAHRLSGGIKDFVEIGSNFAMVTTSTPAELVGRPLGTTGLRQRHDVTVVAWCVDGGVWHHATGETVLGAGDSVVVAGAVRAVERFAALTRRT